MSNYVIDDAHNKIAGYSKDETDAAIDAAASNLSNLADAYDATATYAVGDYCIHDNQLYKCNTAITTPEAFNSNHWTATSISNELESLKTKSVTITPSTGVTLNYSSMGVIGNLVACSLITKTTFTASTWKEIGYISKLPTDNINVPCVNNSTGLHAGMARIETTGKVSVYPINSGEFAVDFSIAYITT